MAQSYFFPHVFFFSLSRVWHMSASLSVSVSLPLPGLSPHGPKGLCSRDAHQSGAEEKEAPSVNTKCFELVQIANIKWLNNPWVFPEKPLSFWCNKFHLYENWWQRVYTNTKAEKPALFHDDTCLLLKENYSQQVKYVIYRSSPYWHCSVLLMILNLK